MALTDLHSHILPGVDDGSESVAQSLAMLEELSRQGVDHVVATPHFYPHRDTPERFLRRREQALAQLRRQMQGRNLPAISAGAEVYFFRGISQCDYLPELTMGNKSCILIEMPPAPWPDEWYRELEQIAAQWHITAVIAHIDRYIGPLRNRDIPRRLQKCNVLVQANASFFLQRSTAAMALRMVKRGQIHLLGSDCHNMTDRAPEIGPAARRIRKHLGEAALQKLNDNFTNIPGR